MELSTLTCLALMATLLFKHCIFDFVLVTQDELENKGVYFSNSAMTHSFKHAWFSFLSVILVTSLAWPPKHLFVVVLMEFFIHYNIDWLKCKLSKCYTHTDPQYWWLFGLDQLIHGLTYVLMIFILYTLG